MMAINRYRLKHLVKNSHKPARRVNKLLARTDKLLGVILIGNNFVNILASVLATIIAIRIWGDNGMLCRPYIAYFEIGKYYLIAPSKINETSDIGNKNMSEIGFFDTFPSSDSANFDGVWNVYPYFESGNIVISDIQGGFLLIRKSTP